MSSSVPSDIKTAPGVELSSSQKTAVQNVFEILGGGATKQNLQLWTDDAQFHDPLVIARGRKEYEAQFFGLDAAFSKIERLHHEVKSAGNPIIIDFHNKYTVKGIGKEQIVKSELHLTTSPDGNHIVKLVDHWNGEPLPEGGIKNAFRRLNATTTPHLVGERNEGEQKQ